MEDKIKSFLRFCEKHIVKMSAAGVFVFVVWVIANICAWFQHVITCIQAEEWILLIVGAVVFPIALVHGWGIWLGWF